MICVCVFVYMYLRVCRLGFFLCSIWSRPKTKKRNRKVFRHMLLIQTVHLNFSLFSFVLLISENCEPSKKKMSSSSLTCSSTSSQSFPSNQKNRFGLDINFKPMGAVEKGS